MAPSPLKFTRGVPPPESFPTAALSECAQSVLAKDGDLILQYGSAGGYAPLRALIAQQTGVAENQVLLGQGSLQLADFCARLLIEPGTPVYVEEPTYDRALTIYRRARARVVGFPLQADGPDVDVVAARLASGDRPALFYMIPDFQNPSGSVLSLEKRRRLAALAQQHGFWIIEDLPYRRLRYRGAALPSLLELAPDRVLQMSSYSKLISPGLRVGYMILPDALATRLTKMAEDTYINSSYLNQAIVYEFIRRGWLEPNISHLCELYRPRLDAMLAALTAQMDGLATWLRPDGGFFASLSLQASVSADALLSCARQANLELTDGRGFFANGGGDAFIRLPFCALTPPEIADAVARLAEVVRQLP